MWSRAIQLSEYGVKVTGRISAFLRHSLFTTFKRRSLSPVFAPVPSLLAHTRTHSHTRKIAVKRSSGGEGSGSFRLEGRAFNKLFASTPGVFSSSFRATDVDLVFARVRW